MIDELLIGKLEPQFPNFNTFVDNFTKLSYSKEKRPSNVKTKYALNKLNCVYLGDEIFEQGMTIEHIAPEGNSPINCTIGNLILLERNLNEEADKQDYQTKKKIYAKSKNAWVATFVAGHKDWNDTKFEERSRRMAKEFYEKVFGKKIVN
jgi:hypothetical protein